MPALSGRQAGSVDASVRRKVQTFSSSTTASRSRVAAFYGGWNFLTSSIGRGSLGAEVIMDDLELIEALDLVEDDEGDGAMKVA